MSDQQANYAEDNRDGYLRRIGFYLRLLAFLALLYTAHFAASVLVPFVVAVMFALALAPLVRTLERIRIPSWLGAAGVVVVGLVLTGSAILAFSTPAAEWISEAPGKLRQLEPQFVAFRKPIESVKRAGEDVGDLTNIAEGSEDVTVVKVLPPSALDIAVSATPSALAALVAVIFFIYFLLASGQRVTSKLVRLLEYRVNEQKIVSVAQQVQTEMSHYLLTVASINFLLGCVTAIMLCYFEIPNPLLWGAVVATFNFAPYIGAVASSILLLLVALIEFKGLPEAIMVSGSFVAITVLEGQLFTPVILGRRLALSPYIVFIGIVFWGWLWGVPGALMAVPLMVCVKIVCDQIPETKWLAILVQREKLDAQNVAVERPNSPAG